MKTLFCIFLSFSVLAAGPFTSSKTVIHAMPAKGFKVTHNTLDHLMREGLSNKIIAEIALLQNKIFTNREEFLNALPKPMTLIEQGILLRYASTEQIRSEERRVGKECRSRWSPYH